MADLIGLGGQLREVGFLQRRKGNSESWWKRSQKEMSQDGVGGVLGECSAEFAKVG